MEQLNGGIHMSNLWEAIYRYALETLVERYIEYKQRYALNAALSEKKLAWLRDTLAQDARTALEDFHDMDLIARDLHDEALFRAGLAVGLELNRL